MLHCVQHDNYAIFVTLNASEGSQKPRKNITTMKRYIKPTSDIVEIETSPILDGSRYIGKDDETVDPDGSDQLAGGHRDSWDTIWDSMNSSN